MLKCIFYKENLLLDSKTFDPSSNLLLNGIYCNAFLLKKMANIPKYNARDIDLVKTLLSSKETISRFTNVQNNQMWKHKNCNI